MERSDGSATAVGLAGSNDSDWLAGWVARTTRTAAYDIAIKVVFLFWFLFIAKKPFAEFLHYLWHPDAFASPALLASSVIARATVFIFLATLVIFTMLRSRPIAKAPGLAPRISASMGTFMVMLLPFFPHRELSIEVNVLSAIVTLTGNCMAIYVVCRLGRSLSIMAEARRLVTAGPYRYVRNPLYLAEEVAVIGVFIQYASPWTALLLCAHWLFQMARMKNEEHVLRDTFPDEYAAYARTTARLIPGIY